MHSSFCPMCNNWSSRRPSCPACLGRGLDDMPEYPLAKRIWAGGVVHRAIANMKRFARQNEGKNLR